MPGSRSSIFSFETLALGGARPKGLLAAPLAALCLLAFAEIGAHLWIRADSGWDYWDPGAAQKFGRYESKALSGRAPDVLVVGDSTAASDLDPDAMRDRLGGRDVYNLGWPSNFPLAARCSTLPLLRPPHAAPRIVVASFSPLGFVGRASTVRLEENLLSSPRCRRLAGETAPSTWLALPRLGHLAVRGTAPREMRPSGFMPLRGASDPSRTSGRRDPEPTSLREDRLAVLWELARWARSSGAHLVVIIPPVRDAAAGDPVVVAYRRALDRQSARLGFDVLDRHDAAFLHRCDFHDAGHLGVRGARTFSREIAASLAGAD